MTEQASDSQRDIQEHIWLVALYEHETRADELLGRLGAIGVDTGEATIVRVEIDDQLRRARYTQVNDPALSPIARSAVSGALLGGSFALLAGLTSYALGWFMLSVVAGLFNYALVCVAAGALIGALVGSAVASAKQKKKTQTKLPQMPHPASEGYLVAVKMPPPLAERAEEIARGLGAKEILL